MGLMNTVREGAVMASRINVPTTGVGRYARYAGMAAGAGLAGYSASRFNSRRSEGNMANAVGNTRSLAGQALGLGLMGVSARGMGYRGLMKNMGSEISSAYKNSPTYQKGYNSSFMKTYNAGRSVRNFKSGLGF